MKTTFSYYLVMVVFFSVLLLGNIPGNKNEKTAAAPNVVLIFMDDMGYGDPVCYGGGPYRTPHIDALAATGMRFTDFYSAQAVCTASRCALLTGCYPTRLGMFGALNHNSRIALNPEEETIAELLKKKGYRTSIVGKWHLGHKEPYLPLQHGFDEYFGLPYSNDMWPVYYDGKPYTDTTQFRSTYPPLPLIEGNKTIRTLHTLEDQAELTTLYTEKAVKFINENKQRPFFLYLAHTMPHVPLAVSAKFNGKSNAGLFGDVIEEIDWSVGEVIQALRKNKLLENTIVIFTSDNGPWLSYGNHAGNTGGLREGKGTAWDGGVKVPCIISWPGKIKHGTVSSGLMTTMDVLPTLMSLCNGNLPQKKIDGIDFSKLLKGEISSSPRDEFVYYYDRNNLKAVRKGNWKLNFSCISQTYTKPGAIGYDGFPGRYSTDTVYLALYNLDTDPGEDRDVKDQFPEVVKKLEAIAEKYRESIGDGLTGTEGKEVRLPGRMQ